MISMPGNALTSSPISTQRRIALASGIKRLRLASFVLASLPLLAHADDQDVIDYRQHIMKTMGEQQSALEEILAQKAPPDGFLIHLQILAITAGTAKKAFEPKVAGGQAKPDIWAHWGDFAKRLDELTASTAELVRLAKESGMAATPPKIKDALNCKGCHDTYRTEEKQ